MEDYPEVTEDGKRYRLGEYDGQPARFYENGTVLHADTKKLLRGPQDYRLTSERARELNTIKHAAPIEAARRGLAAGLSVQELVDGHNIAWEKVIQAQAELAIDREKGHASTKAAEFVGKAADMLPDRRASRDGGAVPVDNRLLDFLGAIAPVVRGLLEEGAGDTGNDSE